MAKDLDEICYDAIMADEYLVSVTSGRIFSTCVEVPPTDDDNTPLPYIIITDDAYQNDIATKDDIWEGSIDHVRSTIIINAASPAEVKSLRRKIRKAIANYVVTMTADCPFLTASTNEGIMWDWMKPCYYDSLHYSCDMMVDLNEEEDEQEES